MYKLVLALYVAATCSALLILKHGTKSGAILYNTSGKLHLNLNAFIITGIILYGISFVVYTYLIAKYDLGYIFPLATAFVYVAIVTASYFFFHEAFTTIKIAGLVLIVVGLVLLNLNK